MSREKVVVPKYHYFDTPDGHDTFKKLWFVLKPTFFVAGGIATSDVILWSWPKGYKAIAVRFVGVALPIVGISSTFVLATNGVASFRKKDDRTNWFFGGFMTGAVTGALKRNPMWSFNLGMLGGILGVCMKEIKMQGWNIGTEGSRWLRGGATSCLIDLSLKAERPGNWTTGQE